MIRPVGSWDVALDIDAPSAARLPLCVRIARALSQDMRRGRLKPGSRLPGSRELAARLGVHRNTVLAAYAALSAEGWIQTQAGRGTFVSESLPERPARSFTRAAPSVAPRSPRLGFALDGVRPPQPPLQPAVPGRLSMYGGLPDTRLCPRELLARAYRRELRTGAAGLSYGDPRGHAGLRAALAKMLSETRGLAVDADDVMVTRGSQFALWLAAQVSLRAGSVVAVEAFGYRPAWEALKQAGAKLRAVPVDAHGLNIDALAELCARERVSAVYLTPHHQYPTTAQLSPGRRLQLLALAQQERFAIFEDDYDHEFHYEGRPLLPLASADVNGSVVYVGTLSKVLAPGLRLGYLVAPRSMLERTQDLRCYVDRQGDHTTEAAVAELIEEGELQRHLRRTRRIYQARRDHCAALLGQKLGDRLQFRVPRGGMALWARAAPGIDVDRWLERAHEQGVSFHAGKLFAFDGRPRPYLRLGYACLNERELEQAVDRLKRAAP